MSTVIDNNERFLYERPSVERKDEIISFLEEFVEAHSEINGTGGLDKVLKGWTFEQAYERCMRTEDKEYAESIGKCPGKTFWLIRKNDDKIVGTINIRWDLNEKMLRFAGHIGYGIRPSERRKGYSKLNLYMGLKEAQKLGLDRVMIGCSASNTGSEKTILALGGILERRGIDPEDGEESCVYWIDVNKSLEEYKDVYERYLAGE